jgi:hypothetical protein
MGDASDNRDQGPKPPSGARSRRGGHTGPDRRRLVDLVRAERGEPERRRLPRLGDPVVRPEPPADDAG